ncbi:MAG: TetR/AcrR family transcriptional regulator [Sporichthyaceae bacterium]
MSSSTHPETPAQAPASTRDRVLLTAVAMFGRDGYDGVSMRSLAEELGVTKAALYHHFASKEQIALELVSGYFAAVDALVEWISTDRPDLETVLVRWGELARAQGMAVGKFVHGNPRLMRELGVSGPGGGRRAIDVVADAVTGPEAPDELRLRLRMALIGINVVGIASEGLDLTPEQVYALARQVALGVVRSPAVP